MLRNLVKTPSPLVGPRDLKGSISNLSPRTKGKTMRRKRKIIENRKIALERIEILTKLIKEHPNSHYNKRYRELIMKIRKKYRLFRKK